MNTKKFWKTYFADTERFRFIIIFGLIVAIVLALCLKSVLLVIPFCLGYIVQDPFSYYLTTYRRDNP